MTETGAKNPVRDDPNYGDHEAPPDDNVTPLPQRATTAHHAAEKALLGALLLEPARFEQAAKIVNSEDFDEPRHQLIFDAMAAVADRDGVPPDHVLVRAQLHATGNLPKVATSLLPELVTNGANPVAINLYAQHVHEAADRRRIAARLRQAAAHIDQATPGSWRHAIGDVMDEVDAALKFTPTSLGQVTYTAFDGLFSRPRTPVTWVRAPLLAQGRITLMYSPGKTGKSLIAMEAAAAIATGRPALATHNTEPEHVLYVDQEMTEDDWLDRLTDMGYNTTDERLLAQHLHLAQLQSWPPMDTPAGGQALAAEAARLGCTTVIIDTVSKVIVGEENSNDTQSAFYQSTLIPLKRAGAAVLVLDHTGKDIERGARGASAKTDNIDLAFELLQRGRDLLTLRCTHARIRDELLERPTFLRRTEHPLRHVIEEHDTAGNDDHGWRPTLYMERVSQYIEENPGASKNLIELSVKGGAKFKRQALELLILESYIEVVKGPRGTQEHHSIRPYREANETND